VMRTYQTSSGKLVGAIQYAFLIITPTTDQPICVVVENGAELENEFAERYQLSIKTTYTSKRAMLEDDEDDFNTSDASNGELYDAFWGALAAEIGDYEKVYFSPDGVYNQINVQTLFNADTGKFLIEEWEVHVLGSLKDILHSEEEEDMVKSKLAYLIGGPDYLAGAPKDYKGIPKIAYLPGAKQEVQEIEYLLKTNQWTVFAHYDAEATEEQVNEDLSAIKIPQLLHFSTHGFFQEEDTLLKKRPMIKPPHPTQAVNPLLRSGLLLAGAETSRIQQSAKQRDGILTAYEVLNLSLLGTELVTLSACETGLGVNKNGEGVYGLQRAFQIAGASNVLMSMWKVPDKETKELMVHFYEYWLEMGDKRKAFRRAQQEMKDKYPEPFYWGAFVMIGR
ncbi:MAG: CHAT domain-containing protein, partial [Flammeovirgaceae bacterium]